MHSRPGRAIGLSAFIVLGAACHDGTTIVTTPSVAFDAQNALARFDPLAAVFDQPIFKSFDAALSFFEGDFRSTPPAAIVAPSAKPLGTPFLAMRLLAPLGAVTANDIADGARGKTFVYDVASRSYVVDRSATGAPANGVRYVLYDWAPGTGAPATPLARIGYTDIAPITGSNGELTEVVVFRDHPFLVPADFIVRHAVVNGANVFGIEGSATDGFTSDDNVAVDGSYSGADGRHLLIYNTTIASTSLGVSSVEQLTFDQANATQTGALELRYDGHRFTDQSVSAGTELTFDGLLYARVFFPTSPDMAPRYLKPDGTPLTAPEIANLTALLDRAQVASFFWENLAYP